jgi:hypothetical protein
VGVFRPAARVSSLDGREWEIYAYRLQLPQRGTPDPTPFDLGATLQGQAASSLFDGVTYIVSWLPRLLARVFVDLPVAAVRALRSDEWVVEAISWAPYRSSYKWSTTGEVRGQVLVLVECALARGETPHPRNARLLDAR